MAEINEHGNASSSLQMIDDALNGLWHYMSEKGELGDIIIPILGTGRGRLPISRKRMIERIALSFVSKSRNKIFARKLTIVVYHGDAKNFSLNIFDIKDFLAHSLSA